MNRSSAFKTLAVLLLLSQKPSERPSPSPWERPTGVLQWGQNRRSSGTSARAITALDGSTAGAGGTWVSPCPTRPIRIRPEAGLRRGCGRVPNEEARADPRAVEPSWTEAFVIPDSTVSPGPAGGIPQVSQ